MWGQVYKDNQQAIPELKIEIFRVICEIEPQLYQNVIENVNIRVAAAELQEKATWQMLFFCTYAITDFPVTNEKFFWIDEDYPFYSLKRKTWNMKLPLLICMWVLLSGV